MDLNRYAPDDLLLKYLSIRATVPDDIFYNKPMYRKVMEFWCAAQFARGYEKHVAPCAVWVHDGDAQTYFDFQLETKEQRQDFQLTEVLLPGRKRGDEYRTGGPKTRTTVADWDRGEKDGGRWRVCHATFAALMSCLVGCLSLTIPNMSPKRSLAGDVSIFLLHYAIPLNPPPPDRRGRSKRCRRWPAGWEGNERYSRFPAAGGC